MIIGIGIDSIAIKRIDASLKRFGKRFTHRIFTEGERSLCDGRKLRAACYAKRFAAKEAASKALKTGMRQSVAWQQLEVVRQPSGEPRLCLHGRAREIFKASLPAGHDGVLHLTLSDDEGTAEALVILEAVAR